MTGQKKNKRDALRSTTPVQFSMQLGIFGFLKSRCGDSNVSVEKFCRSACVFFLSTFLVEWHSLHAAVSFSFVEQTLPFSLKPGPRHCSFCSGSIFMFELLVLGQTAVND